LTSSVDDKLVEILTSEGDETPVEVRFSRVYGEEATFLRHDEGVAKFGEHSGRYEGYNFFGAAADPESEIS
jgi:catalase